MLSFPSLGRSHEGRWPLDAAQLESVRNTTSTWSLCLLLEATVSSSLGPSPALPAVVTLCSPLLARSHLGHHPGASGRSQSLPAPAPSRPLPPCPLSPTTTLFPPLPHWSPASVSSTQVSFPPPGPSLEHTARSTSNTRSPSLVCFLFSPLECKPQAGILLSFPLCCVPSTSNSVWRELNAP